MEKSEAIVLQTFPSRERDRLVVFLTPGTGKRKGWAYGARSIRNRFGAALEPLSKIHVGWSERGSDEVVRIESVDLIRSLFAVHQDLRSSLAATWLAELVDTFAQAEEPSDLLFRLLDTTSQALLDGASPSAVVTYADVWVLRIGGIFPSIRVCGACGSQLGRPVRFDPEHQVFICERCSIQGMTLLPNDVLDTLGVLLRCPVGEFAATEPPESVLFEIRSVARGLRRSFLGHELKTHDLLMGVLPPGSHP